MEEGRSNWKRYEAKYLVDDFKAAHIRECCLRHLSYDPYSAAQPDRQYPISSVYLDSPDQQCLRGTVERRTQRFKLRMRYYDPKIPEQNGHVFFEIKRKNDGVVSKTRAMVPAALTHQIVEHGFPSFVDGEGLDNKTLENLNKFLALRSRVSASPTVGVFYTREAFENPGDRRVRISIDRDLRYGTLIPGTVRCDAWWPIRLQYAILEIKFTNSFPTWVSDLVHNHEVNRRGVCKYLMCCQSVGQGSRRLHA